MLRAENFPETSFLFALYCGQDNSGEAEARLAGIKTRIALSTLVQFEFENSLRFQAGRFERDRRQGIAPRQTAGALQAFRSDLAADLFQASPFDWPEVLRIAGDLSERHTEPNLYRAMDILHVATALHWNARNFLTFDTRQAQLAKAAGLNCPLKLR